MEGANSVLNILLTGGSEALKIKRVHDKMTEQQLIMTHEEMMMASSKLQMEAKLVAEHGGDKHAYDEALKKLKDKILHLEEQLALIKIADQIDEDTQKGYKETKETAEKASQAGVG